MRRKYYDIVENGGDSCTLLLYGYIGRADDVRSDAVVKDLMEAVGRYNKIDVRINSMGGEVYEGIAIYNALRRCTAEVTIYIDGIAASSASFIAACGKKVLMGRYARLMIHEPSGGCYGNKEEMRNCIGELEGIEKDLVSMYAGRCGKTKDEIKSLYFDGKDHWLTADEALTAKLIDGVYDTDPVEGDSARDIYRTINNRLDSDQPQNKENMAIELETLKTRAPFKDCKSDAEALGLIDCLTTARAETDQLKAENARLKEENKKWNDVAEAKIKKGKEDLLDAAVNDGRITAETRPTYAQLLDKDIELGKKVLAGLPKQKKAVDVIHDEAFNSGDAWEKRQAEIRDQYAKS